MSGTPSEVPGRARIEQVDVLREVLRTLVQGHIGLEVTRYQPGFVLWADRRMLGTPQWLM